jgi:hypothetical protein
MISNEKNKARSVLTFFLILYFIVPHHLINHIYSIKEIKLTDIITIFIFLFLFVSQAKIKIYKWLWYYAIFSTYYLIRSFIEIPISGLYSIIFSIKMIQYLVVMWAISILNKNQILKLIKVIVIFSILYAVIEIMGYPVGLTWGGRLSGQYGGPYEFSVIALLILIFLSNSMKNKIIWFFIVLLTQTKAAVLSLVIYIVEGLRGKKIILTIVILPIFFILLSYFDGRFFKFINNFSEIVSIENIINLFDAIPTLSDRIEYSNEWEKREEIFNGGTDSDLSTQTRLFTYLLAIKSLNLITLIFGNSAGFYGFALDSSIIRIVGEVGIVGSILFYFFIKEITINYPFKRILLLVISLIAFSDVFFSARFLPFLALLNMYYHNEKNSYFK